MIERLAIHRFRGIRDGMLQDLSKINLFVGPNNSGKTALLEMLYLGGVNGRPAQLILEGMPSAIEETESVFEATVPIKYDFLGIKPLPRLRKRHGHKDSWDENPAVLTRDGGIAVNLESLVKKSALKEFRLAASQEEWGDKQSLKFNEEDIGEIASFSLNKQKNIPKVLIPLFFETSGVLPEKSRWHYLWENIWVYQREQKIFIDHFAGWAEEGSLPDPEHVLLFDFHTANDHFETHFAKRVKDSIVEDSNRRGWEEKIAEKLGRVFPMIKDASVKIDDAPGNQGGKSGYIHFPERTRIPVDQFGDGMRHSFKVLASLVALAEDVDDEHPGQFLWEDPELFMHPEALGRLLDEVMQIILQKPIQFFCSTQSLEVLGLLTHIFNTKYKESQSQLRVFSLNLEDGSLKVSKFHFKNLYAWMKNGMDPRFWYAAELPLVCRYREADEVLSEEDLNG